MNDLGILVVDSNPDILDAIGRMFSYFRIRVDNVTSAAAALNNLKSRQYKTMIIAVSMPEIVGVELARRAHEINPELNVVLFVADGPEKILLLTLDPTVSDITEVPLKPCSFGNMLLDIRYRETGKVFLLE